MNTEQLQVTQSYQVLGEQFNSVLNFPKVGEYLDKEIEEGIVNRSMRASASVPPSLKELKIKTSSTPSRAINRDEIQIVGGSSMKCSKRDNKASQR